MNEMYCECEIKSVTKSGVGLELSVVPVGAFKLSFRHDDERIEYAVFSDKKKLCSAKADAEAKFFFLTDGKLNVQYLDAENHTIESSMLIAAAAGRSKVLIGADDVTVTPIKITSVELC